MSRSRARSLVGSIGTASSAEDARLTTEALWESIHDQADQFKGKELEVSGVAASVCHGEKAPPSLVLVGVSGGGKVACDIDPNLSSTRTLLPNIDKGKFVVVKGRCEGIDGNAVKLVNTRIAFVMAAKKRARN